jgi:hypothetical protein
MIEKLRLAADAIEQGKDLQSRIGKPCSHVNNRKWLLMYDDFESGVITIREDTEYRIKPDKPHVGDVIRSRTGLDSYQYRAVELTPEVREALKTAGIEVGE